MRRVLGIICYVLSIAASAAAGYFSYRAYYQKISYEQGLLTFVPLFIVSYWFSTFYGQLISPKGGDLLSHFRLYWEFRGRLIASLLLDMQGSTQQSKQDSYQGKIAC